jgi:hypothetical protein
MSAPRKRDDTLIQTCAWIPKWRLPGAWKIGALCGALRALFSNDPKGAPLETPYHRGIWWSSFELLHITACYAESVKLVT